VWIISIGFPLVAILTSDNPFISDHYIIQNVCLPCAISDEVIFIALYSLIGTYVLLGTILLFQFSFYFRDSTINGSIRRVHTFIFVFILSWLAPIIVTSMQVENFDVPLSLIWLHNINLSLTGFLNYFVWGLGKREKADQSHYLANPSPMQFYDFDSIASPYSDLRSPSFDAMSDASLATMNTATSISYFTDGATELDYRLQWE
jgi:hypothetical protein